MKSFTEQVRGLDSPEYTEEAAFYRLIGFKIKEARKRRKLLQSELSRIIGISQSSLARYEMGETYIPLYDLLRISQSLKMKLSEFIPTC